MIQKLITAIRVFIILALVFGLVYPLLIIGAGQLFFPEKANGSLIAYQDKVIGSSLIAQQFIFPQYFHSRFSVIDYDATRSGGSNLAAFSSQLYQQVQARVQQVRHLNNIDERKTLPADMVLSSASGLDPHISVTNALLQLPRVARHRALSPGVIKRLIYDYLESDFIGIWGKPGVNVLELNLALDQLEAKTN